MFGPTTLKKPAFSRTAQKRRGIKMGAGEDLITMEFLAEDQTLPLVMRPRTAGLNLTAFTLENQAFIQEKLTHYGAILFRGFDLHSSSDFTNYLDAQPWPLIDYMESSTPRQEVAKRVYTSTEFPPEETIALHNELSTAATLPLKVWFFCEVEPGSGGQTPIANIRKVLARIDPEVLETFRQKGWSLIRNYGGGIGLHWKEAFHSEDPMVAENYCNNNLIEFEWLSQQHFRTRQVRPTLATHPKTGQELWFNHMAFWHLANLSAEVREEMILAYGSEGLPYQTFYADGSPIPDEIAHHIRQCYLDEKVMFDWRQGDLLMLDNMLTAHGREPFTGSRKILVGMAEAHTRTDLAPFA